jgi:hypothetical protein
VSGSQSRVYQSIKERRPQYGLNFDMACVRQSDLSFGAVLGEGTFGKVQAVSFKGDCRQRVAKIPKEQYGALASGREFNFLSKLSRGDNPFIVKLRHYFEEKVYLSEDPEAYEYGVVLILGKCSLLVFCYLL